MTVDNSSTDFCAKKTRKTRRARWAATEAWRKHVEASRSEFLRTIAQVANEDNIPPLAERATFALGSF
jgi:hypothetical protein